MSNDYTEHALATNWGKPTWLILTIIKLTLIGQLLYMQTSVCISSYLILITVRSKKVTRESPFTDIAMLTNFL